MISLASVVGAVTAEAQEGIGIGYSDIGVVVGLGGIGGASIALGGRYENIIRHLPDLGDGLLGIQVGADWWNWSSEINQPGVTHSSSVTIIPIGVTANYHLKMENRKVDPFLGAGLGYWLVSGSNCAVVLGVEYCGSGGSYGSGIRVITRAGIRYFYSSSTTLYADLGIGGATINVGLTLRLKAGTQPPGRSPGVVGGAL
ncbi:MAG TPA: hypothetical protein VF981_13765 [Gemmatimonadaceae bacterium]|jgi:hypothetical protein